MSGDLELVPDASAEEPPRIASSDEEMIVGVPLQGVSELVRAPLGGERRRRLSAVLERRVRREREAEVGGSTSHARDVGGGMKVDGMVYDFGSRLEDEAHHHGAFVRCVGNLGEFLCFPSERGESSRERNRRDEGAECRRDEERSLHARGEERNGGE